MKSPVVAVTPGSKTKLADIDPAGVGGCTGKADAHAVYPKLNQKVYDLQGALYAEGKRSLLVILQGMDTSGKDGTIKNLVRAMNPVGVRISNFKTPSAEELSHDFLWRIHKEVPAKGLIGLWNRSHYEDVLMVRVHRLVERAVWERRFDEINAFEKLLSDNGITLVKLFLHISKDEQKERLQERVDNPEKRWKFNPDDLRDRALWSDYQAAYEDVLARCSTEWAPWQVVPADKKWARDLWVADAVAKALADMAPRYPEARFDPKTIVIE